MPRGLSKLRRLALVTLLMCCTTIRAEEICAFSTAGFPGEHFQAEVTYERLSDGRLLVEVYIGGVEGEFDADIRLYYGVSPSFDGTGEPVSMPASLSLAMPLHQELEGTARRAEMIMAARAPHVAFLLTLHELKGERVSCPEQYLAVVLAGSAPPNEDQGALARFRPVADH